jgi:hypothetical protein
VIKMPITTDPTTDIGKVRLLITDVTDEQIQAFLDMHGGSVFRAAAQGADTIAFSEVLVSKKIRTQDLATDGPAVAKEMRALAQALRDRAGEVDEDGETFAMDIVPYEDPLITSDRWTAFGAGW